MALTTSEMTPADIAAVTGGGNRGNDGGFGWGGEGSWFIIILFLFAFLGWGGVGFGGFNGAGGGATPYMTSAVTQADLQRGFDNQAVVTKLDGLTHGLCDSTYALNNTITSGFSAAELSRCNQQAALMQQLSAMQMTAQQCCCDNLRAIDGVKFTIAQEDCATRNLMQNNTRDVLENQNSNTRAILDALTAQRIEAKDQRIAEQQQMITQLQLSASQAAQNATLMAAMDANKAELLRRTGHDCPTAAYIVQPPTPVNFPTNCCGTFTGGWGNNFGTCNG